MTVTVMSSREARTKWRDLLDGARAGRDAIIEQSGQPVAALIPYADYEAILAELEGRRASPEVIAAYEEWKRDPSTAEPYEKLVAQLMDEEHPTKPELRAALQRVIGQLPADLAREALDFILFTQARREEDAYLWQQVEETQAYRQGHPDSVVTATAEEWEKYTAHLDNEND